MFESSPLTIRGALIPGMLLPEESDNYISNLILARKKLLNATRAYLWFVADSREEEENRGPVLLLPLYLFTEMGHEADIFIVARFGLVLKTTGVKGTLRRVGFFRYARLSVICDIPLRNLWLFDDEATSITDPLEGLSDDLYHRYEEIPDCGSRVRDSVEKDFDWTGVFSGGFTFDLV